MRIKIAILGSTGSIGKSTLEIIKKNKSKFNVELLMAQNNFKALINQAKIFGAANVLIVNKKYYAKIKKALRISKEQEKVAINTYKTVKLSSMVSALINNGLKAYLNGTSIIDPVIDLIFLRLCKTNILEAENFVKNSVTIGS